MQCFNKFFDKYIANTYPPMEFTVFHGIHYFTGHSFVMGMPANNARVRS